MANLLARLRSSGDEQRHQSIGFDDWVNMFQFGGLNYPLGLNTTFTPGGVDEPSRDLSGFHALMSSCPPAFAAQMVRALVLSQARFTFRASRGSPNAGKKFGTQALAPLERPWPNATTGELISLMEWHAGPSGNAFVARRGRRLRVLRPDWVSIMHGSPDGDDDPYAPFDVDAELLGYAYHKGGAGNGGSVEFFSPREVAHWSPIPDPLNPWRGMSWFAPAIHEAMGDKAVTQHKLKFFENGAPQPLDAKVLTSTGWSTMGEIQVGDRVIGSDGKPHPVVAVYPKGERDIYRVHFSSGASAECTEDHLWTVASAYDRQRGTTRTMTLAQIMGGGVCYKSGPAKWSVPTVAPVEFDDPGPLALDPYLLGSLLGDGCMRGRGTASLAAHTEDADEQQRLIEPLLPADVTVTRRDRGHDSGGHSTELYLRRVIGTARTNALAEALRSLGVWDMLGHEKAIPEQYMRSSVTQRVALLQGLIDTDGSIEARQPNTVRFDSTSERLARQVAELAGGLGAVASVRPSRTATERNRPQWRVTISRLPEWITPCRLTRKAAMYRSTVRGGGWRYIQRVEFIGRKPAQCIGVDSEDHLYVTDDFVLTHNTPNLVVNGIPATTKQQFDELVEMMEDSHAGLRNAYRTLYLTAGADATVVGSNLAELDLKGVQGSFETRIALLSRVPPTVLSIAEGNQGAGLNLGNFGQARRSFADSWVYPMLQDLSSALGTIIDVPDGAELWTDTSDMPFLRQDETDVVEIQSKKTAMVNALITNGWDPDSAVAAVEHEDLSQLEHTGLLSVQLQPPGQTTSSPAAPPDPSTEE